MLHSAPCMTDYLALVDALVRPRLEAMAALDPDGATQLVNELASSNESFFCGVPEISQGALIRKVGCAGAWVWGVGHVHHRSFATLAVGRSDAEGAIPVTFDLNEAEEEHPCPWRWDLVSLFASVALAKANQKGSTFAALVSRAVDGYLATLTQSADGSEAGNPAPELPPAVQALISQRSGEVASASHLSQYLSTETDEPRLRLASGWTRDLSARAFFLPALSSLYAEAARITPIDVIRRDVLGRRQYLAAIRERPTPRSERLRLLEIHERPPSALARLLAVQPFAPMAGPAQRLTVALGGDPYQRLLHGPGMSYSVRTFCHCRQVLDLQRLDDAELHLLSRAWGMALAAFQVRGLRGMKVDVSTRCREISAELGEARKDLARQAWEHAAYLDRAYAAMRQIGKHWPDEPTASR
jgi:hypothetical protein